jgi:predicted acetyltransferase
MEPELVRLAADDAVYARLVQCYEAEFSAITGKRPDAAGLFALDTRLGGTVQGWACLVDRLPAGIAAVQSHGGHNHEICEFYVVPCHRRHGVGRTFAHRLWRALPGRWTIKQIAGADHALAFWRRAIAGAGVQELVEDRFRDPHWGEVTRQRFRIPAGG